MNKHKKFEKVTTKTIQKLCVKCGKPFSTTDPNATECWRCILAGFGRRRPRGEES